MSFLDFEHNGRTHRLAFARTAEGVWLGWPGRAKFFPRERPSARVAAGGPHREDVRAPMSGRIVKVRVAPGDVVKENDLLVILEAMKMEYRLGAPHAGVVEVVDCREGDLVDLGRILVRMAE